MLQTQRQIQSLHVCLCHLLMMHIVKVVISGVGYTILARQTNDKEDNKGVAFV